MSRVTALAALPVSHTSPSSVPALVRLTAPLPPAVFTLAVPPRISAPAALVKVSLLPTRATPVLLATMLALLSTVPFPARITPRLPVMLAPVRLIMLPLPDRRTPTVPLMLAPPSLITVPPWYIDTASLPVPWMLAPAELVTLAALSLVKTP